MRYKGSQRYSGSRTYRGSRLALSLLVPLIKASNAASRNNTDEVVRIGLYGVTANFMSPSTTEQTTDGTLHPLLWRKNPFKCHLAN
jgi:hypothetical protein